MDAKNVEQLEKIRQQFESLPYPHRRLDEHPKNVDQTLDQYFIHCLATPYYLRHQRVPDTQGRIILDAGCGSGYKALRLADANPGAKIVGIDISPESVRLAEERLKYYGHDNVEFHAILLEDLPQLGLEFDYINCDEVLYLLPDPDLGLKALKSVLKPDGILRTNLHSSIQRQMFYRSQALFRMMGLMDDNPGEAEIAIVKETMMALKDGADLKKLAWDADFAKAGNEHHVLMNHLIQGDKGYTVPEMLTALETAGLELINMVNWAYWDLSALFLGGDRLSPFWADQLNTLPQAERLHIYELMHPIHRLLDFWCGHPRSIGNKPGLRESLNEWTDEDWMGAIAHLHPLLRTPDIRQDAIKSIAEQRPFEFSQYIAQSSLTKVFLEEQAVSVLLPLWEAPQPVQALVEHYRHLYPTDWVTLEPTTPDAALAQVKRILSLLEPSLHVLLERGV